MAIQSWGYGTAASQIVPGTVWASFQVILASRYATEFYSSGRVTPKTDGTRQVNIASGILGGWGILDQITGTETATLPVVSSGKRWFLIGLLRTWQTTNASTIIVIDAGTADPPTALPARSTSPGSVDVQPLALVPLSANDTVPGEPIDVRWIGTSPSDVIVMNELATTYNNYPGLRFRDPAGNEWSRTLTSAGANVLIKNPPRGRSALTVIPNPGTALASDWSQANLGSRAIRDGNGIDLVLNVGKRSGGDVPVSAGGHAVDTHFYTLAPGLEPDTDRLGIACSYINPEGSDVMGSCRIDTSGKVFFTAGTPGRDLAVRPNNERSISLTTYYLQSAAT